MEPQAAGFSRVMLSAVFLLGICIAGSFCTEAAKVTDFSRKNLPPSWPYLFGTDWLGRDTVGAYPERHVLQVFIGIVSAAISAVIALVLGIASAVLGKKADSIITWLIDLIMGIPHILLLILISVAVGKGVKGVVIGVALTHWPSLARLIRAEVLQIKESPYIQIAEKLGKSKWYIARKRYHSPAFASVYRGTDPYFSSVILHESSVTFLGFGFSRNSLP